MIQAESATWGPSYALLATPSQAMLDDMALCYRTPWVSAQTAPAPQRNLGVFATGERWSIYPRGSPCIPFPKPLPCCAAPCRSCS